jgi:hypothetical protein
MVTSAEFRILALSFPDTGELPHFDRASFRWRKHIFATLREKDGTAMVKLSVTDQDVFCAFDDQQTFYPVPGGWGKKGATLVNLNLVRKDMLADALACAYELAVNKHPSKSKK